MSKLTLLRDKDPKEVAKLLSVISSSLLPNPGIDQIIHQSGTDEEFVKAILGEVRERLRVPEGDESVNTLSRIYDFLSNEISAATLAHTDINKIKSRLGKRGYLHPSQYQVAFRYSFGASEILGERKSNIVEAVTHPDRVDNLRASHLPETDDPRITISLKSITPQRTEDRFKLIILSYREGSAQEVDCAFRAYFDEVDVEESDEPLNVLRSFVNTYGVTFRLGDIIGKFVHNEISSFGLEFMTRPAALSIQPLEGQKGNYYYPLAAGASTSIAGAKGGLVSSIVLAFAIDITRYMSSLRRHHVQVVPETEGKKHHFFVI